MILKEGGNVFRNEKGPITQRIATDDIKPTVDWMNSTFGFKFTDEEMLGTTGKKRSDDGTFEKNSSGDIDLNTDARELPKEEIIAKLTAWCQKQGIPDLEIMNKGRTFTKGWVANAGDQIHFRTPIRGNPDNGFVQTDFMMTMNPALQKGAKRGGTEKFTGADRAVMLSSLARGRGLKFSPKFGVVDPNNGDKVVADEWNKIAEILLGKGATEKDTHTVEQMLAKIKNDPAYEELIAGIKGSFEKQGRMFPESKKGIQHGMMLAEKKKGTHGKACWDGYRRGEGNSCIKVKKRTENSKPITKSRVVMKEGARIDHLEDLIFFEGSAGAVRALESLKNLEKGGHENVTLKWDGSPAVIFGRDENGEFIFTDKGGFGKAGGKGRAKSSDELKAELLNRSGGKFKDDPKRIEFANSMGEVFNVYEKAVPQDYRGYLKGDLLYKTTPPVKNNEYIFKPQLVEYRVDTNSDIGKKIGASTSGIVIHREVDANGSESALKNNPLQGNSVMVFPPVYVQRAPEVDNTPIVRLAKIIQKDRADIDSLLDKNKLAQKQMKNFHELLYTYTNSKVDTGLDNMGKDFMRWLDSAKISQKMKNKVAEYIKENVKAFRSLWEVHTGIMKAKDEVIRNMDQQGDLPVKQYINGKPGGEGYVLAHPEGDVKFVNRAEFTAANRAVKR